MLIVLYSAQILAFALTMACLVQHTTNNEKKWKSKDQLSPYVCNINQNPEAFVFYNTAVRFATWHGQIDRNALIAACDAAFACLNEGHWPLSIFQCPFVKELEACQGLHFGSCVAEAQRHLLEVHSGWKNHLGPVCVFSRFFSSYPGSNHYMLYLVEINPDLPLFRDSHVDDCSNATSPFWCWPSQAVTLGRWCNGCHDSVVAYGAACAPKGSVLPEELLL